MELLDGLIDDETLLHDFPAPLAQAVEDHLKLRSAHANLLATLVVPDTHLAAVSRAVPAEGRLPVSVIPTGGAGGLLALAGRHVPGIQISSAEPALRDLDDLAGSAARVASAAAELDFETDVFVAVPYAPGWEAAVELLEAAGLYGKIEVAGIARTVEQLSILIEADLPFKITDGGAGNWMAMLQVVQALVDGASRSDAARLAGADDRGHGAAWVATLDQATQSRIRRRVRRVGTIRTQQLLDDLAPPPP